MRHKTVQLSLLSLVEWMGRAKSAARAILIVVSRHIEASGAGLSSMRKPKSGHLLPKSFLALVLLFAPPAFADDIIGVASVIDGDTIEIHGTRIRLHVIDAPESDQLCVRPDGERWRRGQQVSFALADHIGRSVVRREPKDRDRYSPSATQPTASTI